MGAAESAGSRVLCTHDDEVRGLAALPGDRLASGSHDGTVRLWALETGESVHTLVCQSRVHALVLVPGGYLASGGLDGNIRLWDYEAGQCVRTMEHGDTIWALTMLSLGLASGAEDRSIRLWNTQTGECLGILEGHRDGVNALAELPGNILASGSIDCTIRVWNVDTGECIRTLTRHSGGVCALAALYGGVLASGSGDKSIKLWAPQTGKCLRTLDGHSSSVLAVVQLPEGHLASGSRDLTIKLWVPDTGECTRTLLGHQYAIVTLAPLPGGLLASGSEDNAVRLWTLQPGENEGKYLVFLDRFADEEAVTYIKELRRFLEGRQVPVFTVQLGAGQSFADKTMERLRCMKAVCTVCHGEFWAKNGDDSRSYPELKYAYEHEVPIFAVQLCEWPEPESVGPNTQQNIIFKKSLVRVDGRLLTTEGVAAAISGAWKALP